MQQSREFLEGVGGVEEEDGTRESKRSPSPPTTDRIHLVAVVAVVTSDRTARCPVAFIVQTICTTHVGSRRQRPRNRTLPPSAGSTAERLKRRLAKIIETSFFKRRDTMLGPSFLTFEIHTVLHLRESFPDHQGPRDQVPTGFCALTPCSEATTRQGPLKGQLIARHNFVKMSLLFHLLCNCAY
ncbi:hypothetical protein CC2G_014783 [Coprinopsis cinerea AmutBmut pab1-1]|nr:hypothetical protein CC2G_014783 [Coprinopsis cinerea AmutBmut pab1-1]